MRTNDDVSAGVVDPSDAPRSKAISPRKQAANRANAAKSTGPRTPEGKARSSLNAVRHGLAARASLLPGEDPAELDALARELEADLRPNGATQRELVGRIVGLQWRLRRLARAEEVLWDDAERERVACDDRAERFQSIFSHLPRRRVSPSVSASAAEFVARQFTKSPAMRGACSALERMGVYEQRLDRALHAALRQLRELQKQRPAQDEDAPKDEPHVQTEQNEPTAEPSDSERIDPPIADMQNEPTASAPPAPQVTQPDPPDRPPGVI